MCTLDGGEHSRHIKFVVTDAPTYNSLSSIAVAAYGNRISLSCCRHIVWSREVDHNVARLRPGRHGAHKKSLRSSVPPVVHGRGRINHRLRGARNAGFHPMAGLSRIKTEGSWEHPSSGTFSNADPSRVSTARVRNCRWRPVFVGRGLVFPVNCG